MEGGARGGKGKPHVWQGRTGTHGREGGTYDREEYMVVKDTWWGEKDN